MPEFLPQIPGLMFLAVYVVYLVVIFFIFRNLILSRFGNVYHTVSINEDQYYVFTRRKNIEDIFFYLTYKLYAKGYLIKNEGGYFININKDKSLLGVDEDNVYNLYNAPIKPSEYVEENRAKLSFLGNFYNRELANGKILVNRGKVSNNGQGSGLIIEIIAYILMYVPGVLRLGGGITHGKKVSFLIMLIIVSFGIFVSTFRKSGVNEKQLMKDTMKNYVKGMKAAKFEKKSYEDLMRRYFLGKGLKNILGVTIASGILYEAYNEIINTYDGSGFDGGHGSGCSSCSSCSSCGGGCSSCGGGCGGCGA